MRDIKFRGKHLGNGKWVFGSLVIGKDGSHYIHTGGRNKTAILKIVPESAGQFTGKQLNGVDLYEGDILRQEYAKDSGDKMSWLVITWIEEWCMFGCLNITEGEYQEYIDGGAEKLDESMFWTFPLDPDEKYCKTFLCGNIYSNPELLNPLPSQP